MKTETRNKRGEKEVVERERERGTKGAERGEREIERGQREGRERVLHNQGLQDVYSAEGSALRSELPERHFLYCSLTHTHI